MIQSSWQSEFLARFNSYQHDSCQLRKLRHDDILGVVALTNKTLCCDRDAADESVHAATQLQLHIQVQ